MMKNRRLKAIRPKENHYPTSGAEHKYAQITQSISRRGNCLDNAVMERFFRSLKTERLNRINFINHEAVVCEVEKYISFYNHRRRHSVIGYMTPHQKYIEMKNAA